MYDLVVQLADGNPLGICAKVDNCLNHTCPFQYYGNLSVTQQHCIKINQVFIRHARFNKNNKKYGYGKWICSTKALTEQKDFFSSTELAWLSNYLLLHGTNNEYGCDVCGERYIDVKKGNICSKCGKPFEIT